MQHMRLSGGDTITYPVKHIETSKLFLISEPVAELYKRESLNHLKKNYITPVDICKSENPLYSYYQLDQLLRFGTDMRIRGLSRFNFIHYGHETSFISPIIESDRKLLTIAGFLLNITSSFHMTKEGHSIDILLRLREWDIFCQKYEKILNDFQLTIDRVSRKRYVKVSLLKPDDNRRIKFERFFDFLTYGLYGYKPWVDGEYIRMPSYLISASDEEKLAFLRGIVESNTILYPKFNDCLHKTFTTQAGYISYIILLNSVGIRYTARYYPSKDYTKGVYKVFATLDIKHRDITFVYDNRDISPHHICNSKKAIQAFDINILDGIPFFVNGYRLIY